jgi:hypothetical protein
MSQRFGVRMDPELQNVIDAHSEAVWFCILKVMTGSYSRSLTRSTSTKAGVTHLTCLRG